MSLLGKALVDWASTQTGYSTYFPGAIHPDTQPQGTSAAGLPYGWTECLSRIPHFGLSLTPLSHTERVRVRITGDTRKAATGARDWLVGLIGSNPVNLTIGSLNLKNWRVEDDGSDSNEDRQDSSDENIRSVDLDLVGNY